MRSSWANAALAGALALPAVASAAPPVVSASATLASDYVFRGVSQTLEDPALQAGIHLEHASGVFAGAWASAVDSPSRNIPAGTRDVELDLYLGYGLDLGGPWSLAANVVRYDYPVVDESYDYDYVEWGLALRRGAVALSASWSADGLGFYGDSVALEAELRRPLTRRLELAAGLGRYDLGRIDDAYLYWNLGLARSVGGRIVLDLGYYGTDGTAERLWPGLAGDRAVASITVRIP